MSLPFWIIFTAVAAAAASGVATGYVTEQLRRRAILDHPNARSSHETPTPRGGGIGVMAGLTAVWIGILLFTWGGDWGYLLREAAPLIAALALAGVSFIDDLRDLPPWARLLAQAAAVGMMLGYAGGPDQLAFQGLLPVWLDYFVVALAWLWFVNLFNFMDGIDGISGVEMIVVGFGGALVFVASERFAPAAVQGAILSGAAIGFLWWNWHPAKVFMGDVGSVPLGFLLGWLLVQLAWQGHWHAVLLLPLYYWCDATLTLLRRIFRREKVWRAHKAHIYQKAVQRGRGHAQVSTAVGVCGGLLAVVAVGVGHVSDGEFILRFVSVGCGLIIVAATFVWLLRSPVR